MVLIEVQTDSKKLLVAARCLLFCYSSYIIMQSMYGSERKMYHWSHPYHLLFVSSDMMCITVQTKRTVCDNFETYVCTCVNPPELPHARDSFYFLFVSLSLALNQSIYPIYCGLKKSVFELASASFFLLLQVARTFFLCAREVAHFLCAKSFVSFLLKFMLFLFYSS